MSDKTKIEWADATVNAINGCSVLSPGCTNCYAMKLAGTRLKHHPSRAGLTTDSKAGPVWTGEVRLNETALLQPLRWKAPRRIFWNAHGDLFHENVPDEWIDRVFAVCALTPQHQHLILTKRSARMREYMTDLMRAATIVPAAVLAIPQVGKDLMVATADWPLPNVWLGVSVEDQARADQRIPDLLATPAAVRFISAEPLLGLVDLRAICPLDAHGKINAADGWHAGEKCAKLNWVIVGGESGQHARPMHPDWARSLRDQCRDAGVPFFFKQWGEHWPSELCPNQLDGRAWRYQIDGTAAWELEEYGVPYNDAPKVSFLRVGKAKAGRLLDGREWSEFPA